MSGARVQWKTKINEIKVSYKGNIKITDLPEVTCSEDAADLLYQHWNKKNIGLHESFKVILLNKAIRVKGIYEVSSGGITQRPIDIRMLFAVLLNTASTSVILAHNHPSGTLKPSESDKRLTRRISEAGNLLGITVLDHLILTPDGQYFSFLDGGLMYG